MLKDGEIVQIIRRGNQCTRNVKVVEAVEALRLEELMDLS